MLTRILNAFGYERRAADSPFAPDTWGRAIRPAMHASPGSVQSNLAVATACIRLRAELMAKVSCKVFEITASGDRVRVTDHPLSRVLNDLANPMMTSFEMIEWLSRQLDCFGNAVARIDRDVAGQVAALWPLEWNRVSVERLESGRIRYRYSGERGPTILLLEDVLHIRDASDDGLIGISKIARARQALELAINQQETANTLAATGMTINGAMSVPGKMSDQAQRNFKTAVEKEHAGPKKAGRMLVLEDGVKFIPTQFSSLDSEALEGRKLSNEDVCRIFGVPPASVGISTSVSYGSALQAQQDLVSNTLAPLAARMEQSFMRCLLSEAGRRRYVIEFDLASLLRGDDQQQWTVHKVQREIGAASVNEIRRIHNQPPIEGGDDYTPLRAAPAAAEPPIATVKP